MDNYDRDHIYLHPLLDKNLASILTDIEKQLPDAWRAKLISGHRTSDDQFIIYKKGREFSNGSWRKTGTTYTNIDGYSRLSRHNYLPAMAMDIGLFRPDGGYEPEKYYSRIGIVAKKYQLSWGGNWKKFKDRPHIEIPASRLFKRTLVRDAALQWQKYLLHAEVYQGKLDGLFGPKSRAALKALIGSDLPDLKAWEFLYKRFGPVYRLPEFDAYTFIPAIL